MMNKLKNRRGAIDLLLAAILAMGAIFLPAVQSGKAFNRAGAPGAEVAIGR